jgi:DNA invertase Pin-like site-specific DNA recombinase
MHATAKTYLGAGGGAIDVQASVGLAGYGTRGRVTAPGLPKAELQQLVATIGQLPDIEIDDLDFSIHCRLPGRRRYTSSIGLALAMSLLSSYLRRPIPQNSLFLGELDLGRGLRPFDDLLLSDLISDLAADPAMARPWRIYAHPMSANAMPTGGGIHGIGCEKLETVLYSVWPTHGQAARAATFNGSRCPFGGTGPPRDGPFQTTMNEGYNYTGKRYVASVRASDDTEGTTSTQAQLAMLHDAAAKLKMIRVGEVILDGVTGSMPGKRDDMLQLINRKKEYNDFDVLVIQRLDRLTRSGPNHGFWFEYECTRAGIQLLIVGDDIPQGPYSSMIRAAKYEAAKDQAFSISQRSTQGYQLALEEGRVSASSQTPYACWRLYLSADSQPLHVIRNLGDGRQQKLHPTTHAVIETYGQVGGGAKGHYRKQKSEKPLIIPGDAEKVAVVRDIFDLHFRQGLGGRRIADVLNRKAIASPQGRKWSQRQVEVIYNNEVYTGINVANRTTSGIYHQRNHAAPKMTNIDPSILANAKTIPPKVRPPSEWVIPEEPLMHDFLGDETLRAMAVEGQRKYWQHVANPDRRR